MILSNNCTMTLSVGEIQCQPMVNHNDGMFKHCTKSHNALVHNAQLCFYEFWVMRDWNLVVGILTILGGDILVYPGIVVYQHTLALKFRVHVVIFLNVCWTIFLMMRRIEVFRKVICKIIITSLPIYIKFLVGDTIFDPIKSHVPCFTLFFF